MIVRMWRGAVRPGDADAYVAYVEATGMRDYRETPGNLGAWTLRRDHGDRTEVVTLSFWASMEAITAFAGPEPDRARYYPEDDRYLIERPERVDHFESADPAGHLPS